MADSLTMNPDIPNEFQRPPTNAAKSFAFLLALAAIVGLVPLFLMRQAAHQPFGPGRPMPQIEAQGWLNGEGPTRESLAGKVVVLNVWASW